MALLADIVFDYSEGIVCLLAGTTFPAVASSFSTRKKSMLRNGKHGFPSVEGTGNTALSHAEERETRLCDRVSDSRLLFSIGETQDLGLAKSMHVKDPQSHVLRSVFHGEK